MALVNPTIFQIVGFQNSGKTTFVKKLINQLKREQVNVVTIKHHGHGGKPLFHEDKDSYQHIKAGALASIVEGDGHLIVQSEKNAWTLTEQIQLLSFFQPDIILVEGHKYETYPKGLIIRKEEDLSLLESLTNIEIVFYWDDKLLETKIRDLKIPAFSIHDPYGIEWLSKYLQNAISKG